MTGREEMIKVFVERDKKFLEANPMLIGFYNYLSINKSAKTIDSYIHIIKEFLDIVQHAPEQLTFDDFAFYMNKSKYKLNGDIATNSAMICKYHALKNYSKYLFATRLISEDYMSFMARPKTNESQQTIAKREIGFLAKEEIRLLLDAVKNGVGTNRAKSYQKKWKTRDYAIILLFLMTGMRVSALASVDIDDIDFENKILLVTDKGDKVKEYILNEVMISGLKSWINDRKEVAKPNEKSLFVTKYGDRMMPEAYRELVKKYSVNIDGKNITPHKLRATYGTQLYEATNDIYFVQRAMGHSSPLTTEKYIRGQKDVTAQASNIMNDFI